MPEPRSTFAASASTATRLVEVEQNADVLLLAGTGDWLDDFIRCLRGTGDTKAIVVFNESARAGENARILAAVADDCLACPFDSPELPARVRAVMRRRGSDFSRGLEVAADFHALRIRVRDVEARVSRRQFQIFIFLAERRERWIRSDEIITAVFGTHHDVATSLVRVQIPAPAKTARSVAWPHSLMGTGVTCSVLRPVPRRISRPQAHR